MLQHEECHLGRNGWLDFGTPIVAVSQDRDCGAYGSRFEKIFFDCTHVQKSLAA